MNFEYKMVIVTRKDLNLSPGKLAAQVAHAAVACALETKKTNSKWFTKWQSEGGKKAVVRVDCEQDFYPLKEKAEQLRIVTYLVVDAGHTEIPAGTKTVLGIGPAPENLIDQVTGNLPLL
ncbi:MAG: peptidyl-tRNA hydrolase Pth2 [Candidatus Thermoplasmatota archaeon]|jgi:PTH2 family peptidyl-tRNA hydrolase|nr:peptidyl-tRNA hydrolase Pth2 [Candidatus Thermoplasmatota archaeon]